MAQQITYTDKVKSVDIPNPANEKFRADDANEIKSVVNSNATQLDNLDGTNIELIKGGGIVIDQAISDLESNKLDSVNGITGPNVVIDGNDIEYSTGTSINSKIDLTDSQVLVNSQDKIELGGDIGGTVSAPVVNRGAISNDKLASMPTNRIKGRATSGSGDVEDLTVPQTKQMLLIDNVDNTSDADKPVSTATQAGLDGKQSILTVSDTAPVSPDAGDLWLDSTQVKLYAYYNDGDSSQWVSVNSSAFNSTLTTDQATVLSYLSYDAVNEKIIATKAIETTLNSLFLGEQHKMSSGAENIFFTNLGNNTNFYPMWGGLKDQSLTENQGSDGYIPPSGRVYTDMFSTTLGGSPVAASSIGYSGDNYFGVSIAGLGITTVAAEEVNLDNVKLEYRLSVSGRPVYKQVLPQTGILTADSTVEWYFDHPVEIHAGTTIFAEIRKVSRADDSDMGVFQVRVGDTNDPTTGLPRYQVIVHNRLFEDKDLELISPYYKYKALDFKLDSTGSTVLIRDLSLGVDSVLVPHAVNTLEAVANGSEIQIKIKDGAKILVESLPVSGVSINGSFVNSVLNLAVGQLNALFTNTAGFISPDTFVNSFTLSGNNLTLGLNDGVSYTVDVTTLGVDENNFVASGSLNGSDLTLTMDDASTVTVDVTGLSLDENTTVSSGVVSGTDIVLTMSDSSTVTVDASTLGGSSSSGNPVVSGSVIGTDLVLVLDDATQITIDASNMINGSSTFANGADWYISYGAYANENVNSTTSHLDSSRTPPSIGGRAPFYFGTALERGTEFRWNNNANVSHLLGIWDGTEAEAGTYNSRVPSNWSTAFNYHVTGFQASSNVSLTNTTATNKYTPSFGAPLALRFLSDGHITLSDLSGATEVEIAKTINPLVDTSFQLQLGCEANFVFPQFVVQDTENIWEIAHDYNGTESGILNGILDHTVLKSGISIEKGEKIMFMLDEAGSGDYFGTGYSNAATGIVTAEEQLDNQFVYQTNEALVFTQGGVNDWDMNTNANGYFFAASLDQYREGGGSGTVQGMFSLRFNNDGKLTIFDEDAEIKVATAKMDPAVGSSVHLYYGVKGNRAYYSIPVISKQSLTQSNQPDSNYVPVVADQAASVEEGQVLNFQVVSSDNIVNQFVEVDAPSWMTMNQDSGVLSGTAPAFLGTAADTIVVTCKAGNAIGGSVDFTVTVSVTEDATSYTNTKSLQLNGTSAFLQANATLMSAMDRASNGDGNAWTLSMWIKPTTTTSSQTLFNYGSASATSIGSISLNQLNANTLSLTYGTYTSDKIVVLATSCLTVGSWNHILVTFDGGTTGTTSADLSDYYSRFSIAVDGVDQTLVGSHINNGYDGVLNGDDVSDNILRIGRGNNVVNNYFDGIINQVAIWDSDETANLSAIYNSGVAHDLSLLTSSPAHYYEVESSVTTITDKIGSANFTGYNFTSSNLITDTP